MAVTQVTEQDPDIHILLSCDFLSYIKVSLMFISINIFPVHTR